MYLNYLGHYCQCLQEFSRSWIHVYTLLLQLNHLFPGNPHPLNFQVSVFEGTMENYSGPDSKVDLILMVHVCYYFEHTFEQEIKKALQWLNHDGHLILIHKDISPFRQQLGKVSFKKFTKKNSSQQGQRS